MNRDGWSKVSMTAARLEPVIKEGERRGGGWRVPGVRIVGMDGMRIWADRCRE